MYNRREFFSAVTIMKFIIKLFPEITIKSRPVRQRFSKMLQGNIRNVLNQIDENIRVSRDWDHLVVTSREPDKRDALVEALKSTPGIQHFLEVSSFEFTDLHNAYELTHQVWKDKLAGKTFCVRVRRVGEHDFTSVEAERYIGGGLNQFTDAAGVKLKQPDVTVRLEIENQHLYVVTHQHQGIGGFPIATQESVLSLISGGFDSGVSSYELIRRGSRVHYCFFNLGGAAHEIGVKQMAHYLWQKYGSSHRVKFVTIDFEPVVAEILTKVDDSQMGVVLKRMMMRAAAKVAQHYDIPALVTGEAVGQVSSQTLTNLSMIDKVTETLILRPLIARDKQDIIDSARRIGTADIAETMPEYCGVISRKPTVKAVESKLLAEEAHFDTTILEQVVAQARMVDIRDIGRQSNAEVVEVDTVNEVSSEQIVIDIRSDEETENKPLEIDGAQILHIPFFKLGTKFLELEKDKHYLLYCERGVMSKLQALYLKEQGHSNVGVYRNR
ncbi:[ThiS-adenylate] sulfurtransferase [Celerinatantimonas diazotrophica]|uniref:tRNA sulfurtransferase n=2 Tax=Celerinatantimonas diazotrophica TaxID=412034 RepID=A0A4R1K3L0_9GAMM|nr:[ThiS-adenylate] sulfurtransferase [Celerinatantimonas diazotrophica]CAG9297307.1 tRNA sulfurtransferase [Celerinatantimonas diazotrophica]